MKTGFWKRVEQCLFLSIVPRARNRTRGTMLILKQCSTRSFCVVFRHVLTFFKFSRTFLGHELGIETLRALPVDERAHLLLRSVGIRHNLLDKLAEFSMLEVATHQGDTNLLFLLKMRFHVGAVRAPGVVDFADLVWNF